MERFFKSLRLAAILSIIVASSPVFSSPSYSLSKDKSDCHSKDNLKSFIYYFSELGSKQINFIKFPLRYSYVVNNPADPEFLQEKLLMVNSLENLPFMIHNRRALFPSKAERMKEELEMRFINKRKYADVIVFQPDTDNITIYKFMKMDHCWYLNTISSKSI